MRNASLEGAILQDMNVECAVFDGAELKSVSFMKSHGKGVSFRHARMEGAVFDDAKLDSPDFTFASLLSSSFQFFNNANIEGAPTRTGPCTCNAVGLLSSRRGDARVAPPCPITLCVWRSLPYPYLTLGALFLSTSLDRASWHGVQGTLSATFEAATGSLLPGVSPAV